MQRLILILPVADQEKVPSAPTDCLNETMPLAAEANLVKIDHDLSWPWVQSDFQFYDWSDLTFKVTINAQFVFEANQAKLLKCYES